MLYFKTMSRIEKPVFKHNGIKLVQTSLAYPEQYDAFDEVGNQVGYLRLRHGIFRVDVPECGSKTIYKAAPDGDGSFEEDEREKYLIAAIEAIQADKKQ
jgi:hypothetical protein